MSDARTGVDAMTRHGLAGSLGLRLSWASAPWTLTVRLCTRHVLLGIPQLATTTCCCCQGAAAATCARKPCFTGHVLLSVAQVNVTAGRRTYAVCSDRPRPVLAPAAPAPAAPPSAGSGSGGSSTGGGGGGGGGGAALASDAAGSDLRSMTAPRCQPDVPMWLNVSHSVEWVALHPRLRFPGIPGLRVEAGGQVCLLGVMHFRVRAEGFGGQPGWGAACCSSPASPHSLLC